MKKIPSKEFNKYGEKLSKLSDRAFKEMASWINAQGGYSMVDFDDAIAYAYALTKKYGEASASLSALMYDAVAELSNAAVPPAEVAATATIDEVAKNIYGASIFSQNDDYISGVVGRMVKQAGADTTLKNVKRDNAEWAWIGSGDECAFCQILSANGWQPASQAQLNGAHAEHIHSNCTCQFMVRFNKNTDVQGYDPDKNLYYELDGRNIEEKANSLRRIQYQRNKDKINEQKRIAYAKREGNDDEASTE